MSDPIASAPVAVWRSLVVRGLRCGIRREDAEDLASQTLTKALEAFEASRGSFAPFCATIHHNLMKNHWRDRKATTPFVPEIHEPRDPSNPRLELLTEETHAMLREIAERIRRELTEEEDAFFLTLANAFQEAAHASVSRAARDLGLAPAQGWDIFRRIQRKARKHIGEYDSSVLADTITFHSKEELQVGRRMDEVVLIPAERERATESRCMGAIHSRITHRSLSLPLMLAAGCATAGYDRFVATLSDEQRTRLNAIFS